MVRCPICESTCYEVEDIIDEDLSGDEEFHKTIVTCDDCGCTFLIYRIYKWDRDEFIQLIE